MAQNSVTAALNNLQTLVARRQRLNELKRITATLESIQAGHNARVHHHMNIKRFAAEMGVSTMSLEARPGEDEVSMEFLSTLLKTIGDKLKARSARKEAEKDANAAKPGATISNHEKIWGDEYRAAEKALKEAIQRQYLNDAWLDKQTFVEGNVTGGALTQAFELDGKLHTTDIATAWQTHTQRVDGMMVKLKSQIKAYGDGINAIDDDLKKKSAHMVKDEDDVEGFEKHAEEFTRLVKAATKAVNQLTIPGTGISGPLHFLDARVLTFSNKGVKESTQRKAKPANSLPALGKEGVKKMAGLLQTMVTYDDKYNNISWVGMDFKDGAPIREYYNQDDDASSALDDYYDIAYHQRSGDPYDDFYAAIDAWIPVAKAIDQWIDRSIK